MNRPTQASGYDPTGGPDPLPRGVNRAAAVAAGGSSNRRSMMDYHPRIPELPTPAAFLRWRSAVLRRGFW